MKKEHYNLSEIYAETLEVLESDFLSLDSQLILIESLQRFTKFIKVIDSLAPKERQNNYYRYLIGLKKGEIPFDVLRCSFLIYQYKKHGIDTRLLELHTDFNASKTEEYDYVDVPVSDIRFYEDELKKII